MKKAIKVLGAGVLILALALSSFVYAASEIKVSVNGEYVDFDVPPQIINDRTMVPLRAIFEALGAEVEWDGATRTVYAEKDDITVEATIDKKKMYVNGSAKTMDVAPMIVDNRTLVPARFVAEAFGCDVEWDDTKREVTILTENEEYDGLPDEIINAQDE